ncbi:glycoside hydrolase family protein [Francisella salina]|uniref:Glycosyl hydrolase family 32 N-terminal domain-containing protein n=1 Tax=Francisella salina TaxID=573569 RepID=A0ABM5M9I5_FRAST|nr:hypothetical protein [Francisella salina]AEI35789.1 hypothetical protein F7308_0862 [Francisella salina]
MQNWKKIGKIFEPYNNYDWMISHASVPFAENIQNDLFKIYFSCRNKQNESSIGYVVININKPNEIIEVSKEPVLERGELGAFDDSGVMGCCILNNQDNKYLYYIGWNLGVTVPFRNSIGLAVSSDAGDTFKRMFNGPIIDRSRDEPHFVASNCVLKDEGIFKIWYLSCTEWIKIDEKIMHKYHIKYAESKDGINWDREGTIAIDYKDEYEYAISVPRVIKEDGIYKMWFSSRGTKDIPTYRIKYAESKDGINWIRKDEDVCFDVSEREWDSDMLCYPFIFDHNNKRYMLYNGNDYGKTGFGLAVLEND